MEVKYLKKRAILRVLEELYIQDKWVGSSSSNRHIANIVSAQIEKQFLHSKLPETEADLPQDLPGSRAI